jgi:phosphoribosylglycinamide formyltransferase 2
MLWSYRRSICKIQFRNHFANRNQNNNANFVLRTNWSQTRTWRYQESWQPARISDKDLFEAQDMAESNRSTYGAGLCVEFFQQMVFISQNYRHDHTIPVTLAGTQNQRI